MDALLLLYAVGDAKIFSFAFDMLIIRVVRVFTFIDTTARAHAQQADSYDTTQTQQADAYMMIDDIISFSCSIIHAIMALNIITGLYQHEVQTGLTLKSKRV